MGIALRPAEIRRPDLTPAHRATARRATIAVTASNKGFIVMPETEPSPVIRPLGRDTVGDVGRLFDSSAVTRGCWCVWYIIPVREFHAGGGERNGRIFAELAAQESAPMGLLAYIGDLPVGWIAAGPRSRYARAVKTPTLRGGDPGEDDKVWLTSCFFVRREFRRRGIAGLLLAGAVALASRHGARAVEGFPTRGGRAAPGDSSHVGTEHLFAGHGFRVIRQPSRSRVVMRLDLRQAGSDT